MGLLDNIGNLSNMLNSKEGLGGVISQLGDLAGVKPEDIINKVKNGEIDKDQAEKTIKELAAKFGFEDKANELLSKLK